MYIKLNIEIQFSPAPLLYLVHKIAGISASLNQMRNNVWLSGVFITERHEKEACLVVHMKNQ